MVLSVLQLEKTSEKKVKNGKKNICFSTAQLP